MRLAYLVVLSLACSGSKGDDADNAPADPTDPATTSDSEPKPTETDTGSDTGSWSSTDTGTPDTGPSTTDTGPTTDSAAFSCGAVVTRFEIDPVNLSTMVEATVELDQAAGVAAWCASDSEPDEVFFAESTDELTDHSLRLGGLIPGHDYTCTAVPVCAVGAQEAVGIPLDAVHTTQRPPNAVQRLTVEQHATIPSAGYWTIAPTTLSMFGGTAYVVIWGAEGRPRWWMALPNGVGMWVEARYHTEDDKLVWGGGMDEEGRMRVVDLYEGETYAFAPPGWQQEEFHHDGKRIADGRLMSLEIRENRGGGSTWDGFGVRIEDPTTGAIDVDIDSQTLVDAGDLPMGGGFNQDPWHANWMEYADTPDGPRVYVSLCFDFSIVVLDALTGELDYRFGRGEGWTLLDDQGNLLGDGVMPQCQHGVEIDGDRWLIYDNGQDRDYSSAQEWTVDPDTMTATLEWSWTEPSWHEEYLGDIDWLGEDHVLITEATLAGSAELVEVEMSSGTVVNRMTFDGGALTYRSERYEGCTFFDSTEACDELAERHEAIEAMLP